MRKIRFNINMRPQIESGEYQVVMRDSDKPVRIICWDADPKYPVCYLEKAASQVLPVLVGPNGSFYEDPSDTDECESRADLFVLVPGEDEFTERDDKLTNYQIDLLAREVNSRVHYGLKVFLIDPKLLGSDPKIVTGIDYDRDPDPSGPCVELNYGIYYHISLVRPYLRPLSSMTDSEWCELDKEIIWAGGVGYNHQFNETTVIPWIDFMLRHHFDYRGLIDMGLAIKAPEGMYNDGK